MLGLITLFVALATQIGFLIYRLVTKNRQTRTKHVLRIGAFAAFTILMIAGVYWWGFRWTGLFAFLVILATISIVSLIRSHHTVAEKPFRRRSVVRTGIRGCILLTLCILPGILFPQFQTFSPPGAMAWPPRA